MNKFGANKNPKNLSSRLAENLQNWYQINKRDLAWRKNKNPYNIWISEIMLQQTTVQAVIPFYERFLKNFPTVNSLASTPLEKVLPLWAGLGYYSRARNLHKAAQIFAQTGFPQTHLELINYPGLGPYTSRAISSLAFEEQVGVLDGNVVRILCRVYGLTSCWWQSREKTELQSKSDLIAQQGPSSIINQAMMELGATICTPKAPACNLCPWQNYCQAFQQNKVLELPLKKPRKSFEIWQWTPTVIIHKKQIALIENNHLPFLKKSFLLPGAAKKLKDKPKKFDFLHTITHHKIYVKINSAFATQSSQFKWIPLKKVSEVNPSSLLQKTINSHLKKDDA
jgi:A/G-specific adenine glycosylase